MLNAISFGGDFLRVNLVMPDDLVTQIDELAKKLGVSRSAYMVMSMSQKVQSETMLNSMPEMQRFMSEMQTKLANVDPKALIDQAMICKE